VVYQQNSKLIGLGQKSAPLRKTLTSEVNIFDFELFDQVQIEV
jgi:hypothetical protein